MMRSALHLAQLSCCHLVTTSCSAAFNSIAIFIAETLAMDSGTSSIRHKDSFSMSHSEDDTNSQDKVIMSMLEETTPLSIPLSIGSSSKDPSKTKQQIEEEEREKMQVLVSNFSEEQLNRYEMFRRSAFPKAAVKRVSNTNTIFFHALTMGMIICSSSNPSPVLQFPKMWSSRSLVSLKSLLEKSLKKVILSFVFS